MNKEIIAGEGGRKIGLHEIDLIEVAQDVWNSKWFIVVLALLGFLFAIVSLSIIKPSYTATIVVSAAEGSDVGSKPGGTLGQLGAAATAFGLNIGTGDSSYFTKYKELLDSDLLPSALFERDDLKPIFFGPTWDPKTRTVQRPTGLIFNLKDFVKGALGLRRWTQPGPFELREALKRKMTVNLDKLTNFLKISLNADSPEQAEQALRAVSMEADELLRRSAKERAAGRIAYLSKILNGTTVQDQRDAIINILSTQERNLMMASVDKTFAMEIIDPVNAPPAPSSPIPSVTLVTDVLIAAVIAILAAIIYGMRARASLRGSGIKSKGLDDKLLAVLRSWRKRRMIRASHRTA